MEKNSFKRLLDEEEQQLPPPPPEIENNLMHSMSFLDFFGKTLELYLPKIFEIFIVMMGGTVKELGSLEQPVLRESGEAEGDYEETPGDAVPPKEPKDLD